MKFFLFASAAQVFQRSSHLPTSNLLVISFFSKKDILYFLCVVGNVISIAAPVALLFRDCAWLQSVFVFRILKAAAADFVTVPVQPPSPKAEWPAAVAAGQTVPTNRHCCSKKNTGQSTRVWSQPLNYTRGKIVKASWSSYQRCTKHQECSKKCFQNILPSLHLQASRSSASKFFILPSHARCWRRVRPALG